MRHDEAMPLLSDLAHDALPGDTAAAVADHAGGCVECRAALAAMRDVRVLADHHDVRAIEAHPASDLLTRYALAPDELVPASRAQVASHVEACGACAAELRLARAAMAGVGWRSWLASWTGFGVPGLEGWLRPALTALALVLVVPAYVGLVEYPRASSEFAQVLGQQAAQSPQVAGPHPIPPPPLDRSPAFEGGPARTLVLHGATRSAGAAAPRVELSQDQQVIPIIIDRRFDPAAAGPLDIRILDATARVVWSGSTTAGALWDSALGASTLLVPARALPPASYTLEIVSHPGGPATFSARFEVAAAPSP